MKILVVSNFYPPHYIGGYELGCRDVVEGLRSRGHSVEVLTSTHGVGRRCDAEGAHRWLAYALERPRGRFDRWKSMAFAEVQNQAAVRRAVRQFRPDLVYIWNVGFTTLSVALAAERAGPPVVYYVSDEWPSGWRADLGAELFGSPRALRAKPLAFTARTMIAASGGFLPSGPPRMRFAQFTSDFIRDRTLEAGYRPEQCWTIRWAVDVDRFPARKHISPSASRILFVGHLSEHKGADTALEAFLKVASAPGGERLQMTFAGGDSADPAFTDRLRSRAAESSVAGRINFAGKLPRDELPKVYAGNDVLIFASRWNEPFSIALLEAMSSGLAVVSTTTGGTPEIVRDGDNALTFAAGDSDDCAGRLSEILADSALFERLGRRARESVVQKHQFPRMLDEVEASLHWAVAAG